MKKRPKLGIAKYCYKGVIQEYKKHHASIKSKEKEESCTWDAFSSPISSHNVLSVSKTRNIVTISFVCTRILCKNKSKTLAGGSCSSVISLNSQSIRISWPKNVSTLCVPSVTKCTTYFSIFYFQHFNEAETSAFCHYGRPQVEGAGWMRNNRTQLSSSKQLY